MVDGTVTARNVEDSTKCATETIQRDGARCGLDVERLPKRYIPILAGFWYADPFPRKSQAILGKSASRMFPRVLVDSRMGA